MQIQNILAYVINLVGRHYFLDYQEITYHAISWYVCADMPRTGERRGHDGDKEKNDDKQTAKTKSTKQKFPENIGSAETVSPISAGCSRCSVSHTDMPKHAECLWNYLCKTISLI